jgi:AcrR family transcriptional regulator
MATNPERSAATRGRLVGAARALFAGNGFAATGTEAILQRAGVQRGALYHHFADKAALFEAVCIALSEEALPIVEAAAARARDPLDALMFGSIAWIDFATRDDVRRILLVDAPNVLGWQRWDALDRQLSQQALHDALGHALSAGTIRFDAGPDLLATMVNGALGALALRVGSMQPAPSPRAWRAAVRALFRALAAGAGAEDAAGQRRRNRR